MNGELEGLETNVVAFPATRHEKKVSTEIIEKQSNKIEEPSATEKPIIETKSRFARLKSCLPRRSAGIL
jgi:hypothetical protein